MVTFPNTPSSLAGSSVSAHTVPVGLPFNVPDGDQYPYSRYIGLGDFVRKLPYGAQWDFISDLGGRRDETPPSGFFDRSFRTSVMLAAYFKMDPANRLTFTQTVSWIRDPVPGRPGGTQTVPPDWPSNMPTPVHHAMTRYTGFDTWVGNLPGNWAEQCRLHVFGIHEPFDPMWWLDYHKTVDVYIMYEKLSPELRATFVTSVSWLPDGPGQVQVPSSGRTGVFTPPEGTSFATFSSNVKLSMRKADACLSPHGTKECYLELFRPEHRTRIAREMGSNPWACAVAAKLLNEPGVWDSGKFVLSFQGLVKDDGMAYVQAHIERSMSGSPITSLLPFLCGTVRLGASSDLNALVNNQSQDQVDTRPTIFPTVPVGAGTSITMNYAVYAMLTTANPSMTFTPLVDPVFSWIFGPYESVKLDSASFTMQVSTGAANSVWASIAGPSVSLSTLDTWLATPINAVINGSDQGYVSSEFIMPTRHPFEPELRSPDPAGNPTPAFRFAAALVTGAKVIIKGNLRVSMAGQYAMGHINIGPGAKKSASRAHALMIAALPYATSGTTQLVLDGDIADDDDDDESDVEEDTRTGGGTTANVGVVRR